MDEYSKIDNTINSSAFLKILSNSLILQIYTHKSNKSSNFTLSTL